MPATIVPTTDDYILNRCTKYLNRAGDPPPPDDDAAADAYRSSIAETWRFPIIDHLSLEPVQQSDDDANLVTFVYKTKPNQSPSVAVVGTFSNLYDPVPFRPVQFLGEPSGYYALSVVVPKGEAHTYKFVVDGQYIVDPINPQRVQLANGRLWSRFFTDGYLQPMVLELWELQLLYRLVEQILPFRTAEAENFLQRFYASLDERDKIASLGGVYRLDESVGEVNAIDKMLAREEAHRLADYRICMRQIDRLLRKRNPNQEPRLMSKEYFIDLYNDMANSRPNNEIDGWDYGEYADPSYFLYILRRHAVVAAFSHPKYCGNVGAAGWAYLAERYVDQNNKTLFDWRPTLEAPWGSSTDYR